MGRTVTMKQLSELSGIPRETISRVLNGFPHVSEQMSRYTALGYGALPVCMATTPRLLARHLKKGKGTLPISVLHLAAGAGFVIPLIGNITTMPGLPASPAGEHIDIDADGTITGLA